MPEEERCTREELIEIAENYWDCTLSGIYDRSRLLIHPDGQRIENGYQTSNHTNSLRGDAKWNINLRPEHTGICHEVPKKYRNYSVVDPARGIVISHVSLIASGKVNHTMRIAEVFLIRDGCIKRIQAIFPVIKNNGGWEHEA